MDAIAATASIGQLVQYGGVVTLTLIRLIKDISQGPLIYKNEECNVRLLLRLVYRISTETDCHNQDDEFVELFRRVERIAQNILHLLKDTSSFVFRVISAVTRQRSISEAFQALRATRELLHLYVTTSLSQDVRAHLKATTYHMGNSTSGEEGKGGGNKKGKGQSHKRSHKEGKSGNTQAPEVNTSASSGFQHVEHGVKYNFSGNVLRDRAFHDFGDDHNHKSSNEPRAAQGPNAMIVTNNQIGEDAYIRLGDSDRPGLAEMYRIHCEKTSATRPESSSPGQGPMEQTSQHATQVNHNHTVTHRLERGPAQDQTTAGRPRQQLRLTGRGSDTNIYGQTGRRPGREASSFDKVPIKNKPVANNADEAEEGEEEEE